MMENHDSGLTLPERVACLALFEAMQARGIIIPEKTNNAPEMKIRMAGVVEQIAVAADRSTGNTPDGKANIDQYDHLLLNEMYLEAQDRVDAIVRSLPQGELRNRISEGAHNTLGEIMVGYYDTVSFRESTVKQQWQDNQVEDAQRRMPIVETGPTQCSINARIDSLDIIDGRFDGNIALSDRQLAKLIIMGFAGAGSEHYSPCVSSIRYDGDYDKGSLNELSVLPNGSFVKSGNDLPGR